MSHGYTGFSCFQVLVNGQATARSFGTAGYVTQNDTLIGTLTVREAVTFSAALRLSSRISRAQRAILVAEVLAEMGLSEQADTPIGTWHIKGISGERCCRVSRVHVASMIAHCMLLVRSQREPQDKLSGKFSGSMGKEMNITLSFLYPRSAE